MVIRWITLVSTVIVLGLIGCTGEHSPPQINSDLTYHQTEDNNIMPSLEQSENLADEETVEIAIEEHSVQIFHANNDVRQQKLSEHNVEELRTWWDSLPEPIQSQVKSNEVEVQVVSTITQTPAQNNIASDVVDAHVENTGKELNKIIGSPTEMTFGVNEVNSSVAQNNDDPTTSISLLKKVPVKLSDFSSQIFLRQGKVSNDNIYSFQYWWMNLPQELRRKIQQREISIEIIAYSIDKGDMDKPQQRIGATSEENALIAADIISQMAGIQKVGNKRHSVAKIETSSLIERATEKNMNYPASEYIQINLKNNKPTISGPTPTL